MKLELRCFGPHKISNFTFWMNELLNFHRLKQQIESANQLNKYQDTNSSINWQ